jgi:TatD DNase family protein
MSMLVDSHCHLNCLDLEAFGGDLDEALALAHAAGVGHFLCVSIDLHRYPEVLAIAKKYPQVYASVGVHPNDCHQETVTTEQLIELGREEKVIALGETGLDYFRSGSETVTTQKQAFRSHIEAAKVLKKPLIIHMRDADEDTIALMAAEGADAVGGVMHCFCGTWETAKKALDLGFYISFSGIVTFKNALELQTIAKKIPADRMLVETDSPYLSPHPHRGKPNHPAQVVIVAQKCAELRGIAFDVLAAQTTENFRRCFNVSLK